LQSRYYDPITGRFINADNVIVSTNNIVTIYNLYSYCRNNIVNLIDHDGKWPRVFIRLVDNRVNCYGYALGRKEFRQVPVKFGASVDTVANAVLKDLKSIGIRSYIIKTKNPHLYTDSKYYAIALRVGYRRDKLLLTRGIYDYHFWVKHQNGTWSHKPGQLASIYMGKCNPSAKSWDLITKYRDILPGIYYVQQSIKNFYNSKTVYIAVEKK